MFISARVFDLFSSVLFLLVTFMSSKITENQTFDSQFVQDLLRRLDAEYRRSELAESRLAKLSDALSMEKQYEKQLAAKDKEKKELQDARMSTRQ